MATGKGQQVSAARAHAPLKVGGKLYVSSGAVGSAAEAQRTAARLQRNGFDTRIKDWGTGVYHIWVVYVYDKTGRRRHIGHGKTSQRMWG